METIQKLLFLRERGILEGCLSAHISHSILCFEQALTNDRARFFDYNINYDALAVSVC